MLEACMWYLYLRKSKRVKATYGDGRIRFVMTEICITPP